MKRFIVLLLAGIMAASTLAACGTTSNTNETAAASQTTVTEQAAQSNNKASTTEAQTTDSSNKNGQQTITTANVTSNGVINASDMFTERDLTQTADTSEAQSLTVSDNNDLSITSAGVYVISGSASNARIIVDAGDDDKVQIVLDNVTIDNSSTPAIYVKNADKVFVTTASGSTNSLTVSGSFTADGDTNTDAVIFSKDDLVLNGQGTLNISSTDNGVTSKDDLKITGGTINITCTSDAIEANESIAIADGNITIKSSKDGLHAENSDDNSTGFIYICGGTLNITAGSDGIQATTAAQIDGGTISVSAGEGIEATYVQINGGNVTVNATDDGINGSNKSSAYSVTVEITGGDVTVNMGQGDTDAIDSNGNLYIKGGNVNITAQSPFDYDGQGQLSGGTVTVNGTQVTELTNQMMGGGMGGGMRGGMGGQPGAMQGGPNGGMGGF